MLKQQLIFIGISLLSFPSISFCQQRGIEIVEKSINYHDPNENWNTFNGELYISQLNGESIVSGERKVKLDLENEFFSMHETKDEYKIMRSMDKGKCAHTINGSNNIKASLLDKYRISCDRDKLYRDYFSYLYGLPMKLNDPGTHIHSKVESVNFNAKACWKVKVTYDVAVGNDIWYFYFDKSNYAMIAYQFFHDEVANDGEYIYLFEEVEVDGIKMPRDRYWYMNKDDKFLGADLLKDN